MFSCFPLKKKKPTWINIHKPLSPSLKLTNTLCGIESVQDEHVSLRTESTRGGSTGGHSSILTSPLQGLPHTQRRTGSMLKGN